MSDGTAAAANMTSTKDLTHFFSLKKKNDKRLMGGVSFDEFLAMKQNGDFEDFELLQDKQMQALFLQ